MSMLSLTDALAAWGTPEFSEVARREIEGIDAERLPLQQGLSRGSYVGSAPHRVMIIDVTAGAESIRVKAGVFYTGIIAGCSCADDPTPVEEEPEYCELCFEIDRGSGLSSVTLC